MKIVPHGYILDNRNCIRLKVNVPVPIHIEQITNVSALNANNISYRSSECLPSPKK